MKKIILSLSVIVALSQTAMAQWTPAGNSIINNTQYLGTTNNTHLDFRTGTGAASTQRMRITNTGLIGIGTGFATPGAALHLQSTTENLSFKIQTVGTNNAEMAFQSGSNASDILTYNNSTGLLGSVLRFNTLSSGTSLSYTSYSGSTTTECFKATETGNFGIGTFAPTYKLHVRNSTGGTAIRADAVNGQIRLFETDGINPEYNYTQIERNANAFHIYQYNHATTSFTPVLTADMNGNVSIGIENSSGYKFAVKGNMIAEQVVVKLYGAWPDFVFNKTNNLMKLYDVEKYINENSHLPNVPSATEVKEKGIDLGEMNKILLQKIEELTLYMIEQQKQIDELKLK